MNSSKQKPQPARNAGMTTYADGSAVLKRITQQQGSGLATEIWDRSRVVASSAIARPEARAALAHAHRDGRLDDDRLDEAVRALERVLADCTAIAVDADLAVAAAGLAAQHELGATDALHLAAALSLEAPRVVFATWSPRLASAAAEHGMAVVPRQPAQVAA